MIIFSTSVAPSVQRSLSMPEILIKHPWEVGRSLHRSFFCLQSLKRLWHQSLGSNSFHKAALEELKSFYSVSLNQSCIRKAVWLTLTELMLLSDLVGGAAEAESAVTGSEFIAG